MPRVFIIKSLSGKKAIETPRGYGYPITQWKEEFKNKILSDRSLETQIMCNHETTFAKKMKVVRRRRQSENAFIYNTLGIKM